MSNAGDVKKKIVIVEDELSIITGLRYVLEREGYELFFSERGSKAYELITASMPDLVIMDYKLPDGNGWDIVEQIKADPLIGAITIIGYTGFSDEEIVQEGIEAGCIEVIVKPIEVSEWINIVSRYM